MRFIVKVIPKEIIVNNETITTYNFLSGKGKWYRPAGKVDLKDFAGQVVAVEPMRVYHKTKISATTGVQYKLSYVYFESLPTLATKKEVEEFDKAMVEIDMATLSELE